MIAFLEGTIQKKELKSLLLNVGGVGYRVYCTLGTLATSQVKKNIFLHIHHHVREDDETLYGFSSEGDLLFFEKLISISGIGPKTALDIMEVPVSSVNAAIESGDVAFLKSLRGIGKKTAERMIVELRGNLPDLDDKDGEIVPPEVFQALTDLGFERIQVQKTFRTLEKPLSSPEEMVRWFLQKTGK